MEYTDNPRRIYGRVEVIYSDNEISRDLQTESNSLAEISHPDEVYEPIIIPTIKACTMDGNSTMDGTFQMMDDSVKCGWWSGCVADSQGVFSNPPWLELQFISRPIISWRIVGDEKLNQYPVNFMVEYKRNGVTIETTTITNNDSLSIQLLPHLVDIEAVRITITKWNTPNAHVKILKFFDKLSEIYEGNALEMFELTEEMGTSDGGYNISSDTMLVSIYNDGRKFDKGYLRSLVVPDRKILPSIGIEKPSGIEYTPLGTFYSDEWKISQDSQWVKCNAVDRLMRLQSKPYVGLPLQMDVSLFDIAEDILSRLDYNSDQEGVFGNSNEDYDYIRTSINVKTPGDVGKSLRLRGYEMTNITIENIGKYKERNNVYKFSTLTNNAWGNRLQLVGINCGNDYISGKRYLGIEMYVYMPESVNAGFIVYDSTGINSQQVNLNNNSHLTEATKSNYVKVYNLNGERVTSGITTNQWYKVELLFADGLYTVANHEQTRKNFYILLNGIGNYYISDVSFIRDGNDQEEITYKASGYEISEDLKDVIIPMAYLPKGTSWDALQEVANAGLCRIYVDRNDKIIVRSENEPTQESDIVVHKGNSFAYASNLSLTEVANRINVEYSDVDVSDELTEAASVTVNLEANASLELTIDYNQDVAYATISSNNPNITLTNFSGGVNAGTVIATNITNTLQTATITVMGNVIEISTKTLTVQDEDSIRDIGVMEYSHPASELVQSHEHAEYIANVLLEKKRAGKGVITNTWRGNPELQIGNTYQSSDRFDETTELTCEYNKITFDGSLRQETRGRKESEEGEE